MMVSREWRICMGQLLQDYGGPGPYVSANTDQQLQLVGRCLQTHQGQESSYCC
jgi:hypothetical protein